MITNNPKFTEETSVGFEMRRGKREDLFLLTHYPSVDPFLEDNWSDVLGAKTFVAWMKLLTIADRSAEAILPAEYGRTVPRSMESLAKLFKMSKSTLYRTVIKPLWNYGLIDLEEWREQKKIGTKAINVIVYQYPQNNSDLRNKPLVKVRDYDTDYTSTSKSYALRNRQGSTAATPNELDKAAMLKELLEEYELSVHHQLLLEYLLNLGIKFNLLVELAKMVKEFAVQDQFSLSEVDAQLDYMNTLLESGETIFDFAKFFFIGLIKRHETFKNVENATQTFEEQYSTAQPKTLGSKFYNWLDERE